MLPNVRLMILNGQLGGVIPYAAGVAAMIGTGVAVAGAIALSSPKLVYSLPDAMAQGIDEVNNPVMYRHIKEFYAEAGDGSELYIMLVPDTMSQTQMCDRTNMVGVTKLINYARGRVRIWTCFYTPAVGYTPVLTNGIDGDVYTAIAKAQQTNEYYATNQMPARSIVEGRAFTGVSANLTDLKTMSNNRVAVLIGGSLSDGTCSVGLLLGRLAKIPVQRKVSRNKNGKLIIDQAFVGSEAVEDSAQLGTINDKGFITLRTFKNVDGYFFNGDQTATSDTDDFKLLGRGRVIDKAAVIAYVTYVEELDDEIIVTDDGNLDPGQVAFLQGKIDKNIKNSMTANREISGSKSYIDPTQDIITNNGTTISLGVRPVGYNSDIVVQLGFDNPNN